MIDHKTWIVIPTYWGSREAGIYDHPTPLDGESTLPRLLDSLEDQKEIQDVPILILVSAASAEEEKAADAAVNAILAQYKNRLRLNTVNAEKCREMDQFFLDSDIDLKLSDLRGYAAVRNMQLLYPAAFGAEVIIALDDDEVIPSDYLSKAVQYIGKEVNGEFIAGLAGPYLDESGSPYLKEPEIIRNLLLDKAVLMNRGMDKLQKGAAPLAKTAAAFGGNMVFHQELFSKVGFDPGITRGEDIDYLINARIAGFDFYFDPELQITHLPPRHYESNEYVKLKQDVIRFVYERKKLLTHAIEAKDLAPYPGDLLGDDLYNAAFYALDQVGDENLYREWGNPQEILEKAETLAEKHIGVFDIFMRNWQDAVGISKAFRKKL